MYSFQEGGDEIRESCKGNKTVRDKKKKRYQKVERMGFFCGLSQGISKGNIREQLLLWNGQRGGRKGD